MIMVRADVDVPVEVPNDFPDDDPFHPLRHGPGALDLRASIASAISEWKRVHVSSYMVRPEFHDVLTECLSELQRQRKEHQKRIPMKRLKQVIEVFETLGIDAYCVAVHDYVVFHPSQPVPEHAQQIAPDGLVQLREAPDCFRSAEFDGWAIDIS
jgi:hypothetical protein